MSRLITDHIPYVAHIIKKRP